MGAEPPVSADLPGAARVVVIGCGSLLRGDDAVGRRVATLVAGWKRPGVTALSVHQLTPELAPVLAAAEVAIFVDAGASDGCSARRRRATVEHAVRVERVGPRGPVGALAHAGAPAALLALALGACGRAPRAYAVTVPVPSFALGARMSRQARRGVAAAIRAIDELIRDGCGAGRA
jgi:hydrogenase maturation protease